MATKSIETGANGARRQRAICAIAAFVLLGLGIWRGAEAFQPVTETPVQLSEQQQQILHVVEPLAGAGNVRVTVRRAGKAARDFLILINSPGGALQPIAKDIEAILGSAVGFDAGRGDTLTVREFPFAKGVAGGPDIAEMVELGVIGLLVFLLSWGAFAPAKVEPELVTRTRPKRTSEVKPARTRPVAVDLSQSGGGKMSSAAKTATEDPAGTAKIIRAWMRSPEASS